MNVKSKFSRRKYIFSKSNTRLQPFDYFNKSLLFLALIFFSCNSTEDPIINPEFGEVIDIEGNKYTTVNIGSQIWMAENLKTASFSNGDPIQELRSDSEWGRPLNFPEVIKPGWSYYENNPSNNEIHGKIYNWYAIADNRNCCPDGWRIPTRSDFETMFGFLGGENEAIRKMKMGGTVWPNSDRANNDSGFSVYPSGYRNNGGSFYDLGNMANFWVSDSYLNVNSISVKYGLMILANTDDFGWNAHSKEWGLSVRCIKK
jgi:uncharacterized protein (TIGR02145 family)